MNAFAKVPFGKVFTISSAAFWRKRYVQTDLADYEVWKIWENQPILSAPCECHFIGTRTVFNGQFTNDETCYPSNRLVNRTGLACAMFQPVDNKWRKPIMVILQPCPGCKKPQSTLGEGTAYLCENCQKQLSDKICHAEFVLEQFCPTCRFCGAIAWEMEDGSVQCDACDSLDDEPGYHDDSGEFPEPDECCQNPLAELVAAIIAENAAAARQCEHCETSEPGTYHRTPWNSILCDECYRDGGYAAAIDAGTAWFSDDFAKFEIKPEA